MKMILRLLFCLIVFVPLAGSFAQELEIVSPVRFLALGDSYTIGQSVPVAERWPEQLADSLEQYGFGVGEVEIIATTGWTTGNLINALNSNDPDSNYSLVSLLIGVNNQFQGRDINEYAEQFEYLLERAIAHASGVVSHVFVVSIPDYAFTPFGNGNQDVTEEIDQFNAVNREITESYGVMYVNITDISRRGLEEPELVASDGLHPSGLMYSEWVSRILDSADINVTVASHSIDHDTSIEIYPNPVSDFLHVKASRDFQFTISNSSGMIVKSGDGSPGEGIDVSDLGAGRFVVTVRLGERVYSKAFVKY